MRPARVLLHYSLIEILPKQLLKDNKFSKCGGNTPSSFLGKAQPPTKLGHLRGISHACQGGGAFGKLRRFEVRHCHLYATVC